MSNLVEGKKYICEELINGKGLFKKDTTVRNYVSLRFIYENGDANPPTHVRFSSDISNYFPINEFKFGKWYTTKTIFDEKARKFRILEE